MGGNLKSLISVIIPVYNTAQYLPRCLDSIIANEYKNLEIICINDGGIDNSLSILQEYEEKDNRIIVVDVPNGGVSKARNLGLDIATGDYICFVDSDDWIHKDFFNVLFLFAEQEDVDIIACRHRITNAYSDDEEINYNTLKTKLYKGNALENHNIKSYIWGRLFKRSIIGNIRFENEVRISEDTLFNADIVSHNHNIKVALIDARMYYYFDNPLSTMNTCSGLDFKVLSYIYLDRAEKADSNFAIEIYLTEAFKNTFSVRYLTKSVADKELRFEIKTLIEQCLWLEKKEKPFGLKKAVLYRIIVHFPFLYSCFRKIKER